MGGINFITNNKNDSANDRKGDDNKENEEIRWTKPVSEKLPGENDGVGLAFKNSLSGKKILETNSPVPSSGFFSRLKKIRLSAKEIKKDKDVLNDYQGVVNGEKELRKKSDSAKLAGGEADAGSKYVVRKNKWQSAEILKTNLIQDEITTFINWNKNIKALSVGLIIAFVLIGGVYALLIFRQMSVEKQRDEIASEITDLTKKIYIMEDSVTEAQKFQKKLKLAGDLVNKHVYWTKFFKFLEDNTLTDIFFTGGFKGDTVGTYSFSAISPSYTDIADQIKFLKANELVKEISVSGGSLSTSKATSTAGSVGFTLGLTVDPKIFNQ